MRRFPFSLVCRLHALCLAVAFASCIAFPALAQDLSGQDEEAAAPDVAPTLATERQTGMIGEQVRTAASAVGRSGARRIRDETIGSEPMARIENRIRNRVQNRIRNRIDRNYDPTANATSPFEAAAERERRAGRPRSR